ncbi:Ac92 [Dikerogammarus haemobaphes nudivirus]|nr:Ac92 [Dikerogammarus haemobaphes nudivirus]
MISIVILTILLSLFFILIILYIQSLYYTNYFIAYRNKLEIKTATTDDIDRSLTFSEYITTLKGLIYNRV